MGLYERSYYQDEDRPDFSPSWNQRSAISIIILANVAVFVFDMFAGSNEQSERVSRWFVLHGSDLLQPWMYWRTITYGFVHDPQSIWHIFWNMFSLWMLGRSIEARYGRGEFTRIYFAALAVCGFGWLIVNVGLGSEQAGQLRLLGASGAVSCISMLFVFNFPKSIIYLFGAFPIPAWVFGILLIVGNVLGERGEIQGTRVAYDVHLFGIGFATIYFFLHWRLDFFSRFRHPIEWMRRWQIRRKMRIYHPQDLDEEAEMDRLLKKLHDHGQDSLTRVERKFMESYSKRVRMKRQQSP